jgi:hypothetical protein
MTRSIDYRSIDVPDDEEPENYHYTARRAELLDHVERAGHPQLVNGARLARRYGCSRQNIYNDLDVLAEYVDETLGDRRVLTTNAVIQRCVAGLLENEEYRKAARTQLEFSEWIDRMHDRSEFADRLDAVEEHLARTADGQRSAAEVLSDAVDRRDRAENGNGDGNATADGGIDVDTSRETDTDST